MGVDDQILGEDNGCDYCSSHPDNFVCTHHSETFRIALYKLKEENKKLKILLKRFVNNDVYPIHQELQKEGHELLQ